VVQKLIHSKRAVFIGIILALLISFSWYQKTVEAYNVVIDGKVVAQVKDKEDFMNAVAAYQENAGKELGHSVKNLSDIELQKARLNPELLETDFTKLTKNVNLAIDGYRLLIDGKQLFAVYDKSVLEKLLEEYKNEFIKGVDQNAIIKSIDFKQKTEIKKDLIEITDLVDSKRAGELLNEKEQEAVVIEVKDGENPWTIARNHDISVADLEKMNPQMDMEKIFPGDRIVVSPFKSRLDVIINLENSVLESIPFKTETVKDNQMYSNQKKLVEPGVLGERKVTYNIVLENGLQVSMNTTKTETIKEPVDRVVRIGTKTTVSRGGSRNYGVVSGKRVSSNFGWRTHPISGKKSFHDGVDIAASHGTGIYAYSAGRVSFAGWNGGYGKVVYIDHGNGLQTRYAHMSAISVRVGERVSAGEKIGAVGSTGNSTGAHLHFEVLKNGSLKNPFDYI